MYNYTSRVYDWNPNNIKMPKMTVETRIEITYALYAATTHKSKVMLDPASNEYIFGIYTL